ncbi:anaerobic ribonucleoside-triphosphate reductase activating protein [Candidatus Woesearchaeota archaeon]|jgi:pyruvate formate lyase activating enzyme|nr:anaerobic ribonucleoside-triphosphate reductase activating protein [Candidatus Woesearchaeota archaeon]MBT6519273.1 anaerobic ribonucleoside-triphosphate reductase activating protein [Candidatus Woesearchaeota archaeon]MBT7368465.1 anaerobic ribonucleoside-triphosphate reductase activating protein [Candidatus Woesearchaeota archaeon]
MIIKGIQKTSLVDYPGKIVATIFLGGCNFQCHYCHNPELVDPAIVNESENISEDEILELLKEKMKYIDGVCITGGEPTIHEDLPNFIKRIKNVCTGFVVKLDTNGTNPKMLLELIEKKLIDYVAMDIKAPLNKYEQITNCTLRKDNIIESVEILKQNKNNICYEFRTTVMREFIKNKDLIEIGEWLKGSKRYAIQQFSFDQKMLNSNYQESIPYDPEELNKMADLIKDCFDEVIVRGV